MKTSVAHHWKALSSKIHPPLPMTPRESQRLVSLLNASFKQQLLKNSNASSSNEHQADLHLQSILANPLFDTKPRTRPTSNCKSQRIGPRLGQLQNHTKQPVDAFKELVSKGTADLEAARFCLRAQFKACLASAATTPKKAMQSSDTALTVLQWLWSSGVEDAGKFLNDSDFVGLLVPFLTTAGYQSRILRWLQRCHCPGETPFSSLRGSDTQGTQRLLFERLISSESLFGDGLESAMNLFVRTTAYLRNSEWTCESRYSAAWYLTLTILRLPKGAEPGPSVTQAFLKTTKNLNDYLLTATVDLFISKPANPQPAFTYFQSRTPIFTKRSRRRHIVLLGLKAAELYLQEGHQTEALWIMDFLQTNYARELGTQAPQTIKPYLWCGFDQMLRSEERNLHLLDTLAV